MRGRHQAIAHLGRLVGHRFVHEAAEDPALAAFYRAYTDEVLPTLPPVEGIEVSSYRDEVVQRFTNPALGDSIDRICAYASDRIAMFVLPAVRDNVAAGRDVRCAAGVVAAWARCAEGRAEDGTPLEIVDPLADQLRSRACAEGDDLAFLGQRDVFGDLVDDPAFTEAYLAARRTLRDDGTRALVPELTPSY